MKTATRTSMLRSRVEYDEQRRGANSFNSSNQYDYPAAMQIDSKKKAKVFPKAIHSAEDDDSQSKRIRMTILERARLRVRSAFMASCRSQSVLLALLVVTPAAFLLLSFSLIISSVPLTYDHDSRSLLLSTRARRSKASSSAESLNSKDNDKTNDVAAAAMNMDRRIRAIVETYSAVVSDFENFQTMSWNVRNMELAYTEEALSGNGDGDGVDGSSEDEGTELRGYPALQQQQAKVSPELRLLRQSMVDGGNNNEGKVDAVEDGEDDIIWDNEDDIPLYFDKLMHLCSPSSNGISGSASGGKGDGSFDVDACWNFLNGLVREPRCTVRLDSRVRCSSSSRSARTNLPKEDRLVRDGSRGGDEVESLLRRHFRDDTINVIILGAGPSGLQMANAISTGKMLELPLTESSVYSNEHTPKPEIRVVVFENRLVHSLSPHSGNGGRGGRKRRYSRDWLTSLELDAFDPQINDPRIVDFFRAVTEAGENIALPINAIETLLLLSNRDWGVKFLYENYNDHERVLESLPNLVVFDATGHRLEELDRDGHGDDGASEVLVRPWSPHIKKNGKKEWYDSYWFDSDAYQDLVRTRSVVEIAERSTHGGTILYPVAPAVANDGGGVSSSPYTAHWLKLNDLRLSEIEFRRLKDSMHDAVRVTKPHSHRWCKEKCDLGTQNSHFSRYCFQWCSQSFAWDSSKQYRSDFYDLMKTGTRHPGFATQVAFLSLTSGQVQDLSYLLSGSSTRRRGGVGRPLRDLPLEKMVQEDVFRDGNKLSSRLEWFLPITEGEAPTANVFTFAPYMYKSPVVPGGIFGKRGRAPVPLLRVGDSLLNGDPNLGNGLCSHVKIIGRFVRRLAMQESF